MHRPRLLALIAITLPLLALQAMPLPAQSSPPHTTAMPATSQTTAQPSVPLQQPLPDVFTAGQPSAQDWSLLAGRGITTVINLRPDNETPDRDQAAEVAAAGLTYRHLPIASAADLNHDTARQLRQLLADAPGPVLLHCASSNRVGALLALAMADAGLPTDEAVALGRRAGMRSTETRLRELLDARPAFSDRPLDADSRDDDGNGTN